MSPHPHSTRDCLGLGGLCSRELVVVVTRFYLMAGNFLTDAHYETREEAERVVRRINRGLKGFGSTLRYGVVELVR